MNRSLWLGLGLIVLSNAVALGGVWYNRSGEAQAHLLLSERELSLVPDALLRGHENSNPRLRLLWRRPGDAWQLPWLDEAKLRELGFAPELPGRRSARPLWLVLELDGPSYRQRLEGRRQALAAAEAALLARPGSEELLRQRDERRRALRQEEREASRLLLVDAGTDAEVLRRTWPDRRRQVLLPGRLTPHLNAAGPGYGASIELDNDRLSVPRQWREVFRDWKGYREERPAVRVEVAFGRRHEPWVVDVR